jgi:hypothetical protein
VAWLGLSAFSFGLAAIAGLSVPDAFRDGGFGFDRLPLLVSLDGVVVPLLVLVVATLSGVAFGFSRAENILVNRFVIEGFSGVSFDAPAGRSNCGAAFPFGRCSTLLSALPFRPVAGVKSGDPVIDDVVLETAGDGSDF